MRLYLNCNSCGCKIAMKNFTRFWRKKLAICIWMKNWLLLILTDSPTINLKLLHLYGHKRPMVTHFAQQNIYLTLVMFILFKLGFQIISNPDYYPHHVGPVCNSDCIWGFLWWQWSKNWHKYQDSGEGWLVQISISM